MSTSDPTVRTFPANGDAPPRDSETRDHRETSSRPTVTSVPRTPTAPVAPLPPTGGEVEPAVPGARAPRPTSARPTGARPAVSAQARPPARTSTGRAGGPGGPRRARLTVARVDPWGVLKLSFLLSVALGIVYVVAAFVMWNVVDGMGVFDDINNVIRQVEGEGSTFEVRDWVGRQRVLSLVTVIAVVNVVILTLLATLFAFLYNLGSALVGGTRVTLTDE